MRNQFDFDRRLVEDASLVSGEELNLVPKETKDDKIDFLKQFKEYWEFEKNFKYNSTFDTSFKKISKEVGLNQEQMDNVMKDLISVIVGKAAESIGLKWSLINDGRYLFGFHRADGSDLVPVLLVPYEFKFSSVKDKLIEWLYKEKKGEIKEPKLQLVETSLGLNQKIKASYKDTDKVNNISVLTQEKAQSLIETFARKNFIHELDFEDDPGIFTKESYSKYIKGRDEVTWIFPLFQDVRFEEFTNRLDTDRTWALCLGVKIDKESNIHLTLWSATYEPDLRYSLYDIKAGKQILGDSVATVDTLNVLFNLVTFAKTEDSGVFYNEYHRQEMENLYKNGTIREIEKATQSFCERIERLMIQLSPRMKSNYAITETCDDSFDFDESI